MLKIIRSYSEPPNSQTPAETGVVPSSPDQSAAENAAQSSTAGGPAGPRGFPVGGCAILAIQDPPCPDGRPGAITFAPDLTLAERRRVVAGIRAWDRLDARRAAAAAKEASEP